MPRADTMGQAGGLRQFPMRRQNGIHRLPHLLLGRWGVLGLLKDDGEVNLLGPRLGRKIAAPVTARVTIRIGHLPIRFSGLAAGVGRVSLRHAHGVPSRAEVRRLAGRRLMPLMPPPAAR